MSVKNKQGSFDIIAKAVEECFGGFTGKAKNSVHERNQLVTRRREFADGNILKVWCDCSDNFEYNRLVKLIYEKNTYAKIK